MDPTVRQPSAHQVDGLVDGVDEVPVVRYAVVLMKLWTTPSCVIWLKVIELSSRLAGIIAPVWPLPSCALTTALIPTSRAAAMHPVPALAGRKYPQTI